KSSIVSVARRVVLLPINTADGCTTAFWASACGPLVLSKFPNKSSTCPSCCANDSSTIVWMRYGLSHVNELSTGTNRLLAVMPEKVPCVAADVEGNSQSVTVSGPLVPLPCNMTENCVPVGISCERKRKSTVYRVPVKFKLCVANDFSVREETWI